MEPPKYEPVVQNQPQLSAPAVGIRDPYRAGYDQPVVSSAPGTQITLNMMMQPQQQHQQLRTWSTSLCGCCEDMASCCLVTWCTPCYLCCSLSPRMGESCCAPFCLTMGGHSVPMVYRTKLRAAHGIAGGAIDDCFTIWCCPHCVLCQMSREMDFIERTTGMRAFPKA